MFSSRGRCCSTGHGQPLQTPQLFRRCWKLQALQPLALYSRAVCRALLWSAGPSRGHHAPSWPHRALSSLSSFKGHSLSAKAEGWSVVKVERKGESLFILSAALSWKHLQILQSLMKQSLQSLLRYLIVQHIFTSFFQTSVRSVYFPTIHVGLDHVTCFLHKGMLAHIQRGRA